MAPVELARLGLPDLSKHQEHTINYIGELARKYNFEVTEEFGQRRLGVPRDSPIEEPPKGCEIFVARLPRNFCEVEILPLFSSYGEIYEMRLMLGFSVSTRGYCFIKYMNPESAQRAIEALDGYEIRDRFGEKRGKIGVVLGRENNKLRLDVSRTANREQICRELHSRRIHPSSLAFNRTKQCYTIDYKSHRDAALARKQLESSLKADPSEVIIAVNWLEPSKVRPNLDCVRHAIISHHPKGQQRRNKFPGFKKHGNFSNLSKKPKPIDPNHNMFNLPSSGHQVPPMSQVLLDVKALQRVVDQLRELNLLQLPPEKSQIY